MEMWDEENLKVIVLCVTSIANAGLFHVEYIYQMKFKKLLESEDRLVV